MQLKFWLDETNFLTVECTLSADDESGPDGFVEVTAAVIADSQLSNILQDQLLDIIGQIADHLGTAQQVPAPAADWRAEFLAATRQSS